MQGMSKRHAFDAAIALQPQGGGLFQGATSPAYANMIGPFGGITAAQVLHAVMVHPHRQGVPVALTVNYAAAVADGRFVVHAHPVRTNRSTQHWMIELRQQDHVVITGTALTALRRQTWGGHEITMPQVPRPDQVPEASGRIGSAWIERYEWRMIEGGVPQVWDGRGQDASVTRLWVRDQPPRPLDFEALASLSDVFFPRIWLRRATIVPVGTVTLTIYFHADEQTLAQAGTGYVLGQSRGSGMRNGYFDEQAHLWSESGELLVTTHQMIYYKE